MALALDDFLAGLEASSEEDFATRFRDRLHAMQAAGGAALAAEIAELRSLCGPLDDAINAELSTLTPTEQRTFLKGLAYFYCMLEIWARNKQGRRLH